MIRLTLSAGVTGVVSGDTFDTLYARADSALYQAKRRGRDQTVWHRIGSPTLNRSGERAI